MRYSALSILGVFLLGISNALAAPATYEIDPAHSSAQFSVRHMMVSNVRGEFSKLSGTLLLDAKNPTASSIEASIDATTIDTRNVDRDTHLKSPAFFDVAKFPTLSFKSKSVVAAGKGKFKVTGELTLHGVSKDVVLAVSAPTPDMKDPWGNVRTGVEATTTINRKDFGLVWNQTLDGGGVLIGDEVQITLDVELIKKVEPKAAAL